MDVKEILKHVDHTLLKQTATWEDIKQICDDGIKYGCASVCIPQTYVNHAAHYVAEQQHYGFGQLPICTVIGFPNGYMTTATKEFETKDALANGADEIDMVINLGMVKNQEYSQVTEEIRLLKEATGDKILKVIIENCYLTEEEKIRMCEAVTEAGADFIKTSTGFGTGGATLEDVILMKQHVGPNVKIKAAGGIRSKEDMELYIGAGCSRIGTSSAIAMLQDGE